MKITTLVAVALSAFPVFAFGQTLITQTQTFSGVPDFSQPLLFNKYNGNVADIQNISVSYSITIEGGQFIVDNDSPTSATTIAQFGAKLNATSTDVGLVDPMFQPIINGVTVANSQTFNLAPDNGDGVNNYDSTGPDGGILKGSPMTSMGSSNVATAAYAGYVGGGTFTVNADASQFGSLSFNSGIETASTPVTAYGTVTVTYTVVPEPSSTALLGLGALGLAFRRSRA